MEQVLVFLVGKERYALEVGHIQEIVESPRLHYIPRASAIFLGAINFHGSVLPILDLVSWLGFSDTHRDGRIIVLPEAPCQLGLSVTGILGILSPATADEFPLQEVNQPAGCVRKVFFHGGESVKLLDVARLRESLEQRAKWTGGEHEP